MLVKVAVVVLLGALLCQMTQTAPVDLSNEEEVEMLADNEEIEDVFYEIKELKRITRQCPFSGGMSGVLGGGANGQGPDIQQMISLARTVLNALDQGGLSGGGGGAFGGNPDVDTNQLGRFRQRG